MHSNLFVACLAIAAFCCQFDLTCSRTSTVWRLNANNGKIIDASLKPSKSNPKKKKTVSVDKLLKELEHSASKGDRTFHIIATLMNKNDETDSGWIRRPPKYDSKPKSKPPKANTTTTASEVPNNIPKSRDEIAAAIANEKLSCGKPVNFTVYDKLPGIEQRHLYHKPVPEPEVAYLFLKTQDELAFRNFNLGVLERKLKQMRYEQRNAMSAELYTHIGNYFRIIGDSRQAIECFRHALAKRAHPKILRNLARVLFNLRYLSDAMRVSLEAITSAPDGYVPWQEYFILGEIFKLSGRTRESSIHLRHALQLNPDHEPILRVLRDVENSVLSSMHVNTFLIIIGLVIAVFVLFVTSTVVRADHCKAKWNNLNVNTNANYSASYCANYSPIQPEVEFRPQKHFNRSMPSRSLKKHKKF